MLHKLIGSTNVLELTEANLSDDGAELSTSSRDTMASRAVTSGENFARNYESCCIGTKILEEVGEAIEEYESLLCGWGGGEFVVAKTEDNEKDGEHNEAHELDGPSSPAVDEQEGNPVSRDKTGCGKDQIPDADIL